MSLSKRDECKKIMGGLFGPATAGKVDSMSEETCVEECKKIVDKFKTVKELMNSEKYNTVYQAISKNKWQEELFKNLIS